MKNIIFLFVFCLSLFASCKAPVALVKNARIVTEDTQIKMDRSRKVIKDGILFHPDNQSDFAFKGKLTGGQVLNFEEALKHGAQKVKIESPHAKEPLYGVLLSSKVKTCSDEPTTRSYEISIPADFVASAQGGLISCRYEYYRCGSNNYTTWVLWLSDMPI